VRPRWQAETPKQPEASVDWCAIGVMVTAPDAGPALAHSSAGNGETLSARHEEIVLLASFYGPHGQMFAGLLRDGISIPQNVETLAVHDIGFVECGPIRSMPELVNQKWLRRRDVSLTFRRKVTRNYPILNVLAADVHLFDDTHIDETIHVPPAP
jgi:hypothetical protein